METLRNAWGRGGRIVNFVTNRYENFGKRQGVFTVPLCNGDENFIWLSYWFCCFYQPTLHDFYWKTMSYRCFYQPTSLDFYWKTIGYCCFYQPTSLDFYWKTIGYCCFTNPFHLIFIKKNLGCLRLIPTTRLFCCKKAVRIFPKRKSFINHENKNYKFLDKSVYFWLATESYCFHGHA